MPFFVSMKKIEARVEERFEWMAEKYHIKGNAEEFSNLKKEIQKVQTMQEQLNNAVDKSKLENNIARMVLAQLKTDVQGIVDKRWQEEMQRNGELVKIVQHQNADIKKLSEQNRQRDTEVKKLFEQIQQQDTRIKQMSEQMQQGDTKVKKLSDWMQQRDTEIKQLFELISQIGSELEALRKEETLGQNEKTDRELKPDETKEPDGKPRSDESKKPDEEHGTSGGMVAPPVLPITPLFTEAINANNRVLEKFISETEKLSRQVEALVDDEETLELYQKLIAKCLKKFTSLREKSSTMQYDADKLANESAKILKQTINRALSQSAIKDLLDGYLKKCGVRRLDWQVGRLVSDDDYGKYLEEPILYDEVTSAQLNGTIKAIEQDTYVIDYVDDGKPQEAVISGIYHIGKYINN